MSAAEARPCADCGAAVERRGVRGPWPKRCPSCKAARSAREAETRPCVDCGGAVDRPSGRGVWASRCPDCRATHERERSRRWRAANPGRQRELTTRWHAAHPERRREHVRRWKEAHPEAHWVMHERRRARKAGAETPLTAAEWAAIQDRHDWRCYVCYAPAPVMEHVVPLAGGGQHEAGNVLPACADCNGSKGSKPLEDWLPGHLAFLREAVRPTA